MENNPLGTFQTLFDKSVPHILEKIFLYLDYEAITICANQVCTTWSQLLKTSRYQKIILHKFLETKNGRIWKWLFGFPRYMPNDARRQKTDNKLTIEEEVQFFILPK